MAKKKVTFLPDLFTSILKLFFILVNEKVAKRKLTFSPDLFTSILQIFFILVNDKLAEKREKASLAFFFVKAGKSGKKEIYL